MLLLTVIAAAPLAPVAVAAIEAAGSPSITESLLGMIVGACLATGVVVAGVTIFITNRLSKGRGLTYQVRDKILAAIKDQRGEFRRWANSHTRGDDDRFELIRREIYGLATRNALKDSGPPPVFQALPRRKSFEEEEDERNNPLRYASDIRMAGITPMVASHDFPRRPEAILPDDDPASG